MLAAAGGGGAAGSGLPEEGLRLARVDPGGLGGFGDAAAQERQPLGIGGQIRFEVDPALQGALRVALLQFRHRQVIARARRGAGVREARLERLHRLRRHLAAGGHDLRLTPVADDVGALFRQFGGVAVGLGGLLVAGDIEIGAAEQDPPDRSSGCSCRCADSFVTAAGMSGCGLSPATDVAPPRRSAKGSSGTEGEPSCQ